MRGLGTPCGGSASVPVPGGHVSCYSSAVHRAVPVHAGLWRPDLPGVPGALLG